MKHNRIVVTVTVKDDPNPRFLLQYATRYLWSCFGIFGVSSIEDLSCPMSIIVAAWNLNGFDEIAKRLRRNDVFFTFETKNGDRPF